VEVAAKRADIVDANLVADRLEQVEVGMDLALDPRRVA